MSLITSDFQHLDSCDLGYEELRDLSPGRFISGFIDMLLLDEAEVMER